MSKILILFAHPLYEKSRVHHELLKQARTVPGITINDLYHHYPDFDIDVEREKSLLVAHDIIIWQHPFYWYSAPAMLKQWQDLVLEHGWAYGKKGRALEGKKIFNAMTSGGGEDAYRSGGHNRYDISSYLIPFERTASLCRMIYWPPFWVPGVHRMDDVQIKKFSTQYRNLLTALKEDIFPEDEINSLTNFNQLVPLNTE